MIVRRIARPLMAGIFIAGGIDTLRHPGPRAKKAQPVAEPVAAAARNSGVSAISDLDAEQIVRIDAAVKVAAGLMLATNRLPRLSALALAASLAPTTVTGHPFWAEKDREARKAQRTHFLKNLSILGGLLTAVVDTGGRESLPHKVSRTAGRAAKKAGDVAG